MSCSSSSTPEGYMTRNSLTRQHSTNNLTPSGRSVTTCKKEVKPAYNIQRSRTESHIIDNLMYTNMNTYTLTQDHSINENPQITDLSLNKETHVNTVLNLFEPPKFMMPNDNAELANVHIASSSQHSYLNEKCSMTLRQRTKSPASCNRNDENLKEDGKPSNLTWNFHDESKTDTNMLDNNPSITHYSDS